MKKLVGRDEGRSDKYSKEMSMLRQSGSGTGGPSCVDLEVWRLRKVLEDKGSWRSSRVEKRSILIIGKFIF